MTAAEAKLDTLLDEVRMLRADLACLFARGQAAAGDGRAAGLASAIFSSVGDRLFTTKELLEHAALPTATALRGAMFAACRGEARALGKLLQKAEGSILAGGLRVVRAGKERDGVVWQVVPIAVMVTASPL